MCALSAASSLPLHGAEWLAPVLSYLLGAVPFGWTMARVIKGVDLRRTGSGNIGATNAMRTLGLPLGALAFALDFLKGWVPAAGIARWLGRGGLAPEWMAVLCGACAVAGHVWPVYLGFRGGKAVATGSGVIVALDPWTFLAGGLAWLATMLATRYIGLASMVMGLVFPLFAGLRAWQGAVGAPFLAWTSLLGVLILIRHRGNLARMRAGTEPHLRLRRRRAAPEEYESHA